jgi:hypothetical protein
MDEKGTSTVCVPVCRDTMMLPEAAHVGGTQFAGGYSAR